jgi:hypothetical protein
MKWHFFRNGYQGLSARAFRGGNDSSSADAKRLNLTLPQVAFPWVALA